MTGSDQPLFAAGAKGVGAQVSELLARRLPPSGATWQTELISVRPHGGGALLLASRSEATGQKVAVKVYRQPQMALVEHRATCAAMQRGVPVIRPLIGDGKLGVFVSAWAEGDTLFEALTKGSLEPALLEVGTWLQRLHAPQTVWPRLRCPSDVLIPLSLRASRWSGAVSGADKVVFQKAVAAVARAAPFTRRGAHRPVRLHGDLALRNFIITAQGPVGLDFGGSRTGFREQDLAKMTASLLLRAELADPVPLDGESARERLLSGYGLTSRVGRAWLDLWEAMELLGRWDQALAGKAARSVGPLRKAQAAKAILARRGWLVALLAFTGEVQLPDERRLGPRPVLAAYAPA